MSKYDSLLKKVEAFEKMAVYSNRKSFLKSISQDTTTDLSNELSNDFDLTDILENEQKSSS